MSFTRPHNVAGGALYAHLPPSTPLYLPLCPSTSLYAPLPPSMPLYASRLRSRLTHTAALDLQRSRLFVAAPHLPVEARGQLRALTEIPARFLSRLHACPLQARAWVLSTWRWPLELPLQRASSRRSFSPAPLPSRIAALWTDPAPRSDPMGGASASHAEGSSCRQLGSVAQDDTPIENVPAEPAQFRRRTAGKAPAAKAETLATLSGIASGKYPSRPSLASRVLTGRAVYHSTSW